MKRMLVLGALIGMGALSIPLAAQRGGAPGQPQGPMVVEVDKIRDNLYVLKGGGGNTAMFVTNNGVVLVDSKNPGWGQPILDQVKKLSDKPVTMVINTHTHPDHVSGQLQFPANVEYVSHANTKTNMEKLPDFQRPENASKLPKRTFTDRLSLLSGNDRIDLYYFGPAHTHGDAWVVFPALGVMHAGDAFAGKQVPLVDMGNGGSGVRYPETLMKVHSGIQRVDTVITGHSNTTMTWADVKQYADFNQDFLNWVRAQRQAGRTPEQAAAEYKVPERFAGYTANLPPFFGGMPGYIKGIYSELGPAR